MATVTLVPLVDGNALTAAKYNGDMNSVLNQFNGNTDEDNLRDGCVSGAKLKIGAVDLAGNKVTGNLPVTHLNSGTSASSSTFWRGDATWANIPESVPGMYKNLYAVGTTSTVTVSADYLILEGTGGTGVRITSVSQAVAFNTTGAGAIDTGAFDIKWYYIWIIRKSSDGTVAGLASLSSTAPTMPANYDQKILVSAVYSTTKSGIGALALSPFVQTGRIYEFTPWRQFYTGTIGANTWSGQSTATFVPSGISKRVFGSIQGIGTCAMSNDSTTAYAFGTEAPNKIVYSGTAGIYESLSFNYQITTADTLYLAGTTAMAVYIAGFEITS